MDNNGEQMNPLYTAFVTNADSITVVSEPGALSFVTRKKWHELPERSLDELKKYMVVNVFMGTSSIFLLLKNMKPIDYHMDTGDAYRLVRIEMDEDGKFRLNTMYLSQAEENQLEQNQATLWE